MKSPSARQGASERFFRFEILALELENLSERVAGCGAPQLPLCAALLREWREKKGAELLLLEIATGDVAEAETSAFERPNEEEA